MPEAKILYLVRHAKSSWNHPELTDFERPLNKRGLHDAPEMGRRMKARGALPEIIICSPAARARETLERMALDVKNVVYDASVYSAAPGELLNTVRAIQNRYRSAMLIGHNPAMTLLAGSLSGQPIDNMPTCAVTTLRLHCEQWSNAGSCAAERIDFDYPKKSSK
jgi:phosphohistidine phosphatase